MTRRIVITGFSPDSRKESPVWGRSCKDFEIWSFNNDYEIIRKAQRHFEMHDLAMYSDKAVDDLSPDSKYEPFLRKGLGIPIYMLRVHKDIPSSVAYPIKDITKIFGTYLTNSFSYMLALAIHEKVDEIHFYGADLAREHEHGWERPSVEYFLGWARGAGIRVVIPETSDLLKCIGLYGYSDAYEDEAVLRDRAERMRSLVERYERSAMTMRGALDDTEYWLRRGYLGGDRANVAKANARKKWLREKREQYEKLARWLIKV